MSVAGALASAVLGGAPALASPVGPAVAGPSGIAAGPDGNMWFTELVGNRIGRITPAGTVREFSTGSGSGPLAITAGPDGNLWFTYIGKCDEVCVDSDRIGRITPAGVVTEFSRGLSPNSRPWGIAAGPDGNIWFTEGAGRIGRITPAGVVTEFSKGMSRDFAPVEIAAGADGNLWFAASERSEIPTHRIGRITTAGVITEFADVYGAGGLAAGPDGNMWLAQSYGRRIGRITPTGAITHFFKGISRGGYPSGITAGPDGNMWFTEGEGNRIGRISTAGEITEFSGLSPGSNPLKIAAGPDGNLWFTEAAGNRIGRITPAGVVSEFPPTARIERVAQRGTRALTVSLHCPPGAAYACRGTLDLSRDAVAGGSHRFSLAPDQRADVTVITTPRLRRLLVAGRHLTVTLRLRPEARTAAGAVSRQVILRTGPPGRPPVRGIRLERPQGIAAGPDGNMWFTECGVSSSSANRGHRIGRITPAGVITEFWKGLARGSCPTAITAGPDGNLWFTDGDAIGRITPDGVITEFWGLTPGSFPRDIVLGPDGNLWATAWQGLKRIAPSGDITEFSQGISEGSSPNGITAGPDGNLWFTEDRLDTESPTPLIGRITPAGVITELPARSRGGGAHDIALGPDGNLWFTESARRIGRITSAGVITTFSQGISPRSSPNDIAAGPDGNLWFTDYTGAAIGRITPQGHVTEFSAGLSRGKDAPSMMFTGVSFLRGIAAGPDGNMWFTEDGGNRIGRITPSGVISEFPATAQILSVRRPGSRSVAVRLRCPAGAALACKGTVQLGKTGNGGSRRLRPLAPGRRTSVVVPIAAAWQRLVAERGRLDVLVLLRPEPNSMAGAIAQPLTLRTTSRPRIPAGTG